MQIEMNFRDARLCSTIGRHQTRRTAAAISCHGLVVSATKVEETSTSTQQARHSRPDTAADEEPSQCIDLTSSSHGIGRRLKIAGERSEQRKLPRVPRHFQAF